jgi:hypothetical protein
MSGLGKKKKKNVIVCAWAESGETAHSSSSRKVGPSFSLVRLASWATAQLLFFLFSFSSLD